MICSAVLHAALSASVVFTLALGISGLAQRPAALPDLHTADLAQGPHSRMHMLLEKTFLRVDVLTVDVHVGERTRQRLEALTARARRLEEVEEQIAAAIIDADHVLVTLTFKRGVDFDRWLQEVRASLRKARESGLISQSSLQDVGNSLPAWFQPMIARGWSSGDRIVYRGYPDRMRTFVVSASGEILVDRTDEGAASRRTMLAGYLAPGTDFRTPLIASLRSSD